MDKKPTQRSRSRSRSRSPPARRRSRSRSPPRRDRRSRSRSPPRRDFDRNSSRGGESRSGRSDARPPRRGRREEEEDLSKYEYGTKATEGDDGKPKVENKEKPNFGLSGKLHEEHKTVKNGVELKWVEPADAAKPKHRWRLFPFKGDQELEVIPLHRKSCYLAGRDRTVADIPTDHPSCSKQHAVIQFRSVLGDPDPITGIAPKTVKPYVVDLGSVNGTHLKNKKTGVKQKLDDARYYELKPGDVLSFGLSTREYVLLYEEMVGNVPNDDAE